MCIYVDDDDTITLDDGYRRARKGHKCKECRRTIKPGETYRYWTTLSYGTFATEKMCAHCWAAIDVAASFTGCPRQWYWGQVFNGDADDGGFMADIIEDHVLPRRKMAYMRLIRHHGRRSWHAPDGSLYPIPVAA